MTSNTIQHFGLTETQIVRRDGQFYLPLNRLSEILGVEKNNLSRNIQRNKEEFGEVAMDKLSTPSGVQDSYLLNEEQVYLMCMLVRSSEMAKEFRKVFATTLRQIRAKEYVHISEIKELRTYLIEAKKMELVLYSKIPHSKINRYDRFREIGLCRKEACKALDLPIKTMTRYDKITGKYIEKEWVKDRTVCRNSTGQIISVEATK